MKTACRCCFSLCVAFGYGCDSSDTAAPRRSEQKEQVDKPVFRQVVVPRETDSSQQQIPAEAPQVRLVDLSPELGLPTTRPPVSRPRQYDSDKFFGLDAAEWREHLNSQYAAVRLEALEALKYLAGRGEPYDKAELEVPELLGLLDDDNAGVRQFALEYFYAWHPRPAVGVPVLIKLMQDPDPVIRKNAAERLGWIGAEAHEAVPLLIEMLSEFDIYAIEALGDIGPDAKAAVPHLFDKLKDGNFWARSAACRALASIDGTSPKVVHELTKSLNDPDKEVRGAAIAALADTGPAARSAVPALLSMPPDRDPRAREHRRSSRRESPLVAMARIAPDDPRVMNTLQAELNDPRGRHLVATEALATMVSQPKAAALLVNLLADTDSRVRKMARDAILELKREALPFLTQTLDHPDADVRSEAVQLTQRLGKLAAPAFDSLMKRLDDDHQYIRKSAIRVLVDMTFQGPWNDLIEHRDPDVRRDLIHALHGAHSYAAENGDPPADLRDFLLQQLGDSHLSVRLAAAAAVVDLFPAYSLQVVPDLIEASHHPDLQVRGEGLINLARIAPMVVPYDDSLLRLLTQAIKPPERGASFHRRRSFDENLERVVLKTLGACGEASVPHAMKILDDPSPEMRRRGLVVVGHLGPQAAATADRLLALIDSEGTQWEALRSSAAEALGKTGATEAIPPLVQMLRDGNFEAPVIALSEMGEAAAESVRNLLGHRDPDVRWHAIKILGAIGPPAKKAVPDLNKLAEREDGYRYAGAVSAAIQRISPESEALKDLPAQQEEDDLSDKSVDQLIDLLNDPDRVRSAAAELARRRSEAKPALMAAIDLLDSDIREMQIAGLTVLERLGAHVEPAVPKLFAMLHDKDAGIRESAGQVIVNLPAVALSPYVESALDSLIRVVESDPVQIRRDESLRAAVKALGTIGPKAEPAVPALVHKLVKSGHWPPPGIHETLANIDTPCVVPLVRELNEAKDPETRGIVTKALVLFGPAAKAAIPTLKKMLQNGREREAAARVLGAIGPDSVVVIDELIEALDQYDVHGVYSDAFAELGPAAVPHLARAAFHDKEPVRDMALRIIGEHFRRNLDEVTRIWIGGLENEQPHVRTRAARAIDRLRISTSRVREALTKAYQDENQVVRQAASEALAATAKFSPQSILDFIPQLLDENPLTRENAREFIRQFATASPPQELESLVPVLIQVLRSDQPIEPGSEAASNRAAAARVLGWLGPQAGAAAPSLVRCLRGTPDEESIHQALARIGESAIPLLITALEEEEPDLRRGAIQSLSAFGARAKPAIGALESSLRDADAEVRTAAVKAIVQVSGSQPLIPHLTRLLNEHDESATDVLRAMRELPTDQIDERLLVELAKQFGSKHPAVRARIASFFERVPREKIVKLDANVIPHVVNGLLDNDRAARSAMNVLASLSHKGAVAEALRLLLTGNDQNAREAAAAVATSLGSEAVRLAPELMNLVTNSRDGADLRLSPQGPSLLDVLLGIPDPKMVPHLMQLMQHQDPLVRYRTMEALARIDHPTAYEELHKLARGSDASLRAVAVRGLATTGKATNATVQLLAGALSAGEPFVRKAAAAALSRLGPAAKSAKPQLVRASNDLYPSVRSAAETALSSW